jgi:guanine deaminase
LIPNLLLWLKSIYRIEAMFADAVYARAIAKAFFRELARNGTTTCCVHGPYFRDATNVAFEEAEASGMRVLMGMNMGDFDLPTDLTFSSTESLNDADQLQSTWSGRAEGLVDYIYTVRPAYCASERLLRGVGDRAQAANCRVQSHLGESAAGRVRIASLFPRMKNETDVYDACGLLTSLTVMAHAVYTDYEELQILAERQVGVAHCPRANLLSGGRQMHLLKYKAAGVRVGLGSDLGAGKGLSLFRTMEDALKVTPDLSIHDLFRLATLEGAHALSLAQVTGSLEVGKDADFLVVSAKRDGREREPDLEDTLSSLVFRGDDRDIRQVFVKGKPVAIA